MSAQERWESQEGKPDPTPLAGLSRVQILARIVTLREIEDRLIEQAQRDGGEGYRCRGAVRIELSGLEMALFKRDRAEQTGGPLPLAVALALVGAPQNEDYLEQQRLDAEAHEAAEQHDAGVASRQNGARS